MKSLQSNTRWLLLLSLCILSCNKDKAQFIPQEEEEVTAIKDPKDCKDIGPITGLTMFSDKVWKYQSSTRADEYILFSFDKALTITTVHEPYPGQTLAVQFWGGNPNDQSHSVHNENVNGKMVRGKSTPTQSILLPSGMKLTMAAPTAQSNIVELSLYDHDRVIYFSIDCGKAFYNIVDTRISQQLDRIQPDGLTTTFEIKEDITFYYIKYNEETLGKKIENRINLASIEKGKPSIVNDLYDDPNLGFTYRH
jgi:hypothetical protein